MLILNDVHIGVQRKAGTTPASQEALRTYLFDSLRSLLDSTPETHLLVLGDLFDTFEVSPRDWVETYSILAGWLGDGCRLSMIPGNHDHSPKALRISSFEMLCTVLRQHDAGGQFWSAPIDSWSVVPGMPSAIVVPHCSNQDVFNAKLGEVLEAANHGNFVLLHANYDNNFAAESDHSLNVSAEQARAFVDKGATLVFAHEHQARVMLNGGVVVLGNQWPTSIADCLGNDKKFAHTLDSDGVIEKIETWGTDGLYTSLDWRDLADYGGWAKFVRVRGDAASSEASEVINAVAKFRGRSAAFVISNAVRIDGIVQMEELPATFEAAKAFDVMKFIEDNLTADEMVVVRDLQKEAA